MRKQAKTKGFAISRILVDDLFGHYSYDLSPELSGAASAANMLILYGDNGSGKTTLLKLLYHMLSPADNKGHRTFLAQTRFRRFEVQLADGTQVVAERSGLEGSYNLSLTSRDEKPIRLTVPAGDDNRVLTLGKDVLSYRPFLRALAQRCTAVHMLSDTRKIQNDLIQEEYDEDDPRRREYIISRELFKGRPSFSENRESEQFETPLDRALERVLQSIRSQTLRASSLGETNVQNLYADIVKRIARPSSRRRSTPLPNTQDLARTLEALSVRSEPFAQYGLTSPIVVDELVGHLISAKDDRQQVLANILAPYVSGLKAKLDALQDTQTLVDAFVEAINAFYKDKSVTFTPGDGLIILSRNKDVLATSALSSGEKQLLHLMCNAILARDQASLFIIDEPEISLNVKWQRDLTTALLNLAKGSDIQFVLATHSIELLTRHRDRVVRLVDTRRSEPDV